MQIDINKVSLSERDIEDWLHANPNAIGDTEEGYIYAWVGRQYQLPSGIADLIGARQSGIAVVIEIKNVPISKAAIMQVCRYGDDVQQIATHLSDYPRVYYRENPYVEKVVIGPSIDEQTLLEASACDVRILLFSAHIHLDIDSTRVSSDYLIKASDMHEALAQEDDWDLCSTDFIEELRAYRDTKERDEAADILSQVDLEGSDPL